jgi:8-oxo-dGTP diphosphatase
VTPPVEAAGWVELRDGRMLAVRARGRDRFFLPGGKPEPGERPEHALVREVAEELSVALDADTIELLGTVEAAAHGYPSGSRVRLGCYRAHGTGDPVPSAEVEEVAWLGPADHDRMAPGCRAAFDAFGPAAGRASMGR